MVYTYICIYIYILEEWNLAICKSMDGIMLSDITLNEISPTKTNIVYSNLYLESKKNKSKNKNMKIIDTDNRLVVANCIPK